MENSCQILYQIAEIYPSVRCKVKHDLALIEGILCFDQFHFETVLSNLLLADSECLFFFFPVLVVPYFISRCCDSYDLIHLPAIPACYFLRQY